MKTAIEDTCKIREWWIYKDNKDKLPAESPNIVISFLLHFIYEPANIERDYKLASIT